MWPTCSVLNECKRRMFSARVSSPNARRFLARLPLWRASRRKDTYTECRFSADAHRYPTRLLFVLTQKHVRIVLRIRVRHGERATLYNNRRLLHVRRTAPSKTRIRNRRQIQAHRIGCVLSLWGRQYAARTAHKNVKRSLHKRHVRNTSLVFAQLRHLIRRMHKNRRFSSDTTSSSSTPTARLPTTNLQRFNKPLS